MPEAKRYEDDEIYASLNPIVATWFKSKFGGFTEAQKYAIIPIRNRKNILVSSPTGSGKTLCCFASILSYLIGLAERNELENKVYAVYCSPLKALTRDVEVNLKQPLEEMEKIAEKKFGIRIAVRTGDTSIAERQKQMKNSPHILITTPETLSIVLNAPKFVENLKAVEFVIIDEIHALANKRGVHLSLSLERLEEMSKISPVRIGLSATISPLSEIAKFLVGYEQGKERKCEIAEISFEKKLDIDILVPVDLDEASGEEMHSSLYKMIDELVQSHRTTLIFTNTRSATERVIHHLKEMFPSRYLEDIGAHHSSLSKEYRLNIEERLRKGELKCIVSSTSLELGIDIGYIDLVLLLGSPKSVARSCQRTGRSGHKLHETIKGRFIVLDRDDLVECSVMLKEIVERKIDNVQIPKNCLDVLSQQIYGMAISRVWDIEEMFSLIKKSYCYSELKREDFLAVLSYLAGEYALEHRNVYAKIWYDAENGKIGKRGKLARVIYMTNIGTIPDESFVSVVLAKREGGEGGRIGMIDEKFLERIRPGDVFVLGGNRYQFLYSKGMKAYVSSSVHKPPNIPSWFSEMLPLSFDLALEIGRFRSLIDEKLRKKSPEETQGFIQKFCYVSESVAKSVFEYMKLQHEYIGIPSSKKIIIENYKGEKNYFIFHSLFGRRVNDALSRAIAYLLGQNVGRDIEIGINDNGFYLCGERIDESKIKKALAFLKPENVEEVLGEAIERTEIFKRRFRHCAARSLMILRNYKGRNKSVGKQQVSSGFLLGTIQKLTKNFPILKETRREIFEEVMDIENAKVVLDWIKNGIVKIEHKTTNIPSPFSLNLIMQGHYDLIKIEDKVEFLRRMYEEYERMV